MSEIETKNPVCESCGFTGNPDDFLPSFSPYHDLKCPEYGSTNIDWDNSSFVHDNLEFDDMEI